MPLLSVEHLGVSFASRQGESQAVRDVSFNLFKGESVALVGESGCGKSALSQALLKVLSFPPAKIVGGKVLFEGVDLLSLPEKQLRAMRGRDIAMVFQDSMASLNPTMKIGRQIVEAVCRHRRLSAFAAKQEALLQLQRVGMSSPESRFEQYPHQLSGGMRQRVAIAMAISCRPSLLIADEPTTALDVTIQAQILDLLKELQQSQRMSLLLITHDLGVVAKMCTRLLVMYGGKIIERGSCSDLFKNPCHPYTFGLLQALPRVDAPQQKKLFSIPGTPPNLKRPPVGCPYFARCPYALEICGEQMPPDFTVNQGQSACWLHDKRADFMQARFSEDKQAWKN